MPMKSKAQRRALWAKDPKLARKFEDETPGKARLPERVRHPARKARKGR